MNNYNNFELLLSAASEECCDKLAKQFLSMDVNEEITPAERKRFNKINRKTSKKNYTTWKPLKVAAVACLICLSLCFVACMCITRVRTAIKETIIEWYEDFASIKFENKDSRPLNDDIHVPDRIVSKARASYLPSRYTCEVEMDTYRYYVVSYYSGDEIMFSLSQQTISDEPKWVNSKNQIFHQITVNGYEGILIENSNKPNVYSVIWQTDSYSFSIMGKFSSMDEAIKIASGIIVNG